MHSPRPGPDVLIQELGWRPSKHVSQALRGLLMRCYGQHSLSNLGCPLQSPRKLPKPRCLSPTLRNPNVIGHEAFKKFKFSRQFEWFINQRRESLTLEVRGPLGASPSPRHTQAGLIPLHSCPGLSLAAFLYLVIFPSLPKHNNSKYSQLPDNKQSQRGELPDCFVPTYGLIQGWPDWALGTGHLSQAGWAPAHRPPQLYSWNPRIPQL